MRLSNRTRRVGAFAIALAMSACNLVDPEANNASNNTTNNTNLDAGGDSGSPEDTGGGEVDTGQQDMGSGEVDLGPDLGKCGGGEPNECGGCATLSGSVGDPCAGSFCGKLACDDDGEALVCSCTAADRCLDSPDGVGCICADGYTGSDEGSCVDVDECPSAPCDPETTCTNTPGSFVCSPCPSNRYDVYSDGTVCQESVVDGVEIITAEITHSGQGEECVEARCPGRKTSLSGGPVGDLTITSSRRSSDGQGWMVCGQSTTTTALEATALCAHVGGEVEVVDAMHTLLSNQGGCFETECPTNAVAVGGGGTWGANVDTDHNHPSPDLKNWELCGVTGTGDQRISVQAVCLTGGIYRLARRDFPAGTQQSGCIQAACDSGEKLIGGGGFWGLDPSRTMNAPVHPGNDTWQICRNSDAADEWWVTAVCVP